MLGLGSHDSASTAMLDNNDLPLPDAIINVIAKEEVDKIIAAIDQDMPMTLKLLFAAEPVLNYFFMVMLYEIGSLFLREAAPDYDLNPNDTQAGFLRIGAGSLSAAAAATVIFSFFRYIEKKIGTRDIRLINQALGSLTPLSSVMEDLPANVRSAIANIGIETPLLSPGFIKAAILVELQKRLPHFSIGGANIGAFAVLLANGASNYFLPLSTGGYVARAAIGVFWGGVLDYLQQKSGGNKDATAHIGGFAVFNTLSDMVARYLAPGVGSSNGQITAASAGAGAFAAAGAVVGKTASSCYAFFSSLCRQRNQHMELPSPTLEEPAGGAYHVM